MGNILLRMIFSMMRGTVMMRRGFTSENASMMIFGEGTRVRKCMWQPFAKQVQSSTISPYMWAIGSIDTIGSPGCRNSKFS